MQSYTKNYFKIYATQLLSIFINVLSLVIVIPYLSNDSKIYGIYTLCISFNIFLSYSDIGFLNAGYKYASEYYAKNKKNEEIKIIGFLTFILLIFTLLFAVVIIIFSFYPSWLIKDISTAKDISVAKNLLLLLALFSPNMLIQRILQIIYGVRVQDYILQTILVVVNALKIASVYFFIKNGQCNIIGYFLFCQITALIGLLVGVFLAKRKFSVSFKSIIANTRFSRETYRSIKGLALSSLYITIAWILFYEFDPYAIAKLSGAEAVAYYSVGLTCLAFFRSIFGALFNPFNARFNHFVALKNFEGLANFSKTVICILLPAIMFPTLALSLLSKQFVYTWIGDKYQQSVQIVALLSLCNLFAFINYPAGILSIATKKTKFIYIISTVQIIVYWGGIILFFHKYGYIVFAYFELACFSITSIFYTFFLCDFLQKNIFIFLKELIVPAILPVGLLIFSLLFLRNYLPLEKNKLYLLEVVITAIVSSGASMLLYYFTSPIFKNYINNIFIRIKQSVTNFGGRKIKLL